MAGRALPPRVAIPTTIALAHADRLPSTSPVVVRSLSRLSRPALLTLVLHWLSAEQQPICAPYLLSPRRPLDRGPYPAQRSLEAVRDVYREMQTRKGGKREVVDRIVEGDWRHGVALIQLAMADVQYMFDHPTSQKWIALKLARLPPPGPSTKGATVPSPQPSDTSQLPRFHAPSFLQNLQREISPFLKAHYYLTRPSSMPLSLLRVQIHDTPYDGPSLSLDPSTTRSSTAADRSKTVYVAFPDGAPYAYVSIATAPGHPAGSKGRDLRNIVLEALPKAFSRPQARYAFHPTALTAKTLDALLALRGAGRGNAAPGGWSIFAEGTVDASPLDRRPTTSTPAKRSHPGAHDRRQRPDPFGFQRRGEQHRRQQRRRLVAHGRFGGAALAGDGKGIERLEIRLEEPISSRTSRARPRPAAASASTHSPTPNILGERHPNRTPLPGPYQDFNKHPPVASSSYVPASISVDERDAHPDPKGHEETSDHDKNLNVRTPEIKLVFQGTHIFAGIRRLVEAGLIDGEAMPGWMTGQEGVSVGVVRGGRILTSSSATEPRMARQPSSMPGISLPHRPSPPVSNSVAAAA